MPAEIELKLTLDRAAVRRAALIARHPAVISARSGRLRTARVISTYYDTPDELLVDAGVTLRIRRDGKRWVQTIKGPPLETASGALHAHDEHEWRLAKPSLDLKRLERTPWARLFAKAQRKGELAPIFSTDVVRRTLPLRFPDGTTATLAIDTGTIRAKRRAGSRVAIAEIEIEIVKGNAGPAYALAQALLDDWPLSIATASKASRGYALAHGEPDGWKKAIRAKPVEFAQDGPAEQALCAVALGCLRQISGNAAGLVADSDPEWLHQMRIGTRRMRSCLSLFEKLAGSERVAPLAKEIRWLARVLGRARDWDVLATETLSPLGAALASDPAAEAGLVRLRRSIAGHRAAARKAARAAVRSKRFQRLLLSIGAFCAEPGIVASDQPVHSARTFAADLLTHRHGKLLGRGATIESATADERHATRIAAKKLRYVAEFFSPPHPGKQNRAYLKALARLQDGLGRSQDAVTATRLMAGLAQKADDATVGAVRGWAAAQIAALRPDISNAWNKFLGTKLFWIRQ